MFEAPTSSGQINASEPAARRKTLSDGEMAPKKKAKLMTSRTKSASAPALPVVEDDNTVEPLRSQEDDNDMEMLTGITAGGGGDNGETVNTASREEDADVDMTTVGNSSSVITKTTIRLSSYSRLFYSPEATLLRVTHPWAELVIPKTGEAPVESGSCERLVDHKIERLRSGLMKSMSNFVDINGRGVLVANLLKEVFQILLYADYIIEDRANHRLQPSEVTDAIREIDNICVLLKTAAKKLKDLEDYALR
ncbi:hypothetical protein HDU76_008229, partial [Blyttiomyces sp. JEL0837]